MRSSAEAIVERLEREVARCLTEQLGDARHLTVALSGGVDSIVLLELARAVGARLKLRIDALHVNHGLSPHADAWELFCRKHCRRRGIAIECVRVTLTGNGRNVEAQARAARYGVFYDARAKALALAHNQDDQAETVLLQLLRGAGVRGLSAMPVRRALEKRDAAAPEAILVRPLLNVSRDEIKRYARRKRLRWIEDESNTDEGFARNFLRARILPLLERRFPGCRRALARSSAHLASADRLMQALAAIDGAGAMDGRRIRVSALQKLQPERAANLLRAFLLENAVQMPATIRLEEMLHQLCTGRRDACPQFHLGDRTLRRYREWIELSNALPVDKPAAAIRWTGESRIVLGDDSEVRVRSVRGRGVSRAKLNGGTITIRRRQGGERMRLDEMRPRRTLKNLLQEAGVRPWLRAHMPLVFRDEELVWAPGIGIACEFRARHAEPAVLFSWNHPVQAPVAGVK